MSNIRSLVSCFRVRKRKVVYKGKKKKKKKRKKKKREIFLPAFRHLAKTHRLVYNWRNLSGFSVFVSARNTMHGQGQFVSPFTTLALVAVLALTNATLPETVKWTGGSFEWPCTTTRNMFKSSGKYISKNVIATRVAMFENKAIVALPRYDETINREWNYKWNN